MSYCSKCGNQINEGAAFCEKCGNAVGNVSSTDTAAQSVDIQQSSQPNSETVTPQKQTAPKKVRSKPFTVLTGLLFAGATVFLIIFFLILLFGDLNQPVTAILPLILSVIFWVGSLLLFKGEVVTACIVIGFSIVMIPVVRTVNDFVVERTATPTANIIAEDIATEEIIGNETEGNSEQQGQAQKNQNQTQKNNENNSKNFNAGEIANNLETEFFYYKSMFSGFAFLVVKNTSEFNLEIECTLKTFDGSDTILSHKSKSEDAVGAGAETIFVFMLDEAFTSYEYGFSVSKENYYESVVQNLTYTSTPARNKEIMTVTNNGDISAQFVEAYVLFFNGGNLVDHESRYFTDNDSELKPGKSITKEVDVYNEYDSYRVVFTGRGR